MGHVGGETLGVKLPDKYKLGVVLKINWPILLNTSCVLLVDILLIKYNTVKVFLNA